MKLDGCPVCRVLRGREARYSDGLLYEDFQDPACSTGSPPRSGRVRAMCASSYDEQYCTRPCSTALFAGDLFEAMPFGDQPTVIYTAEEGDAAGKHFVGDIALGYGLLITPTCDMAEQHREGERRTRTGRSCPSYHWRSCSNGDAPWSTPMNSR